MRASNQVVPVFCLPSHGLVWLGWCGREAKPRLNERKKERNKTRCVMIVSVAKLRCVVASRSSSRAGKLLRSV